MLQIFNPSNTRHLEPHGCHCCLFARNARRYCQFECYANATRTILRLAEVVPKTARSVPRQRDNCGSCKRIYYVVSGDLAAHHETIEILTSPQEIPESQNNRRFIYHPYTDLQCNRTRLVRSNRWQEKLRTNLIKQILYLYFCK